MEVLYLTILFVTNAEQSLPINKPPPHIAELYSNKLSSIKGLQSYIQTKPAPQPAVAELSLNTFPTITGEEL